MRRVVLDDRDVRDPTSNEIVSESSKTRIVRDREDNRMCALAHVSGTRLARGVDDHRGEETSG